MTKKYKTKKNISRKKKLFMKTKKNKPKLNNKQDNNSKNNNNFNYKIIPLKNKKINKLLNHDKLTLIKFTEYNTFYSNSLKYPLIVSENLKEIKFKPKINFVRAEIEDPFSTLDGIELTQQLSLNDYKELKKYGYSPGHNAPAGHHKTSMTNWSDTFYHVNMAPQEITFNAGIWLILEQWCNYTANNRNLKKFIVLTGSIPDKKDTYISPSLSLNIPKFMFKIILAKQKNDNTIYYVCFLCHNLPIDPTNKDTNDIKNYLIEPSKLSTYTGYNVNKVIKYFSNNYNLKKTQTAAEFKFLGNILDIKFDIKGMLEKSLQNGLWFGKLIYSKTIKELESNWKEYQKLNEKYNLNRSLEYHKEYYDLAKTRISKNNK